MNNKWSVIETPMWPAKWKCIPLKVIKNLMQYVITIEQKKQRKHKLIGIMLVNDDL